MLLYSSTHLLPGDGLSLRVGCGVWVVLWPEDGAPDGTGDDLGRGGVEQLHPRLLDVVEEVLGAVKVPQPLPLRGGGQTTYDIHLYLKGDLSGW